MSSVTSYNVSAGPNTTSPSSNSSRYSYSYILPIIKTYYGVEIFMLVIGTFLNLWFLVAILRSRDLRSRLRNKIICNTFVLHLVDSAVVIPYFSVSFILGQYNVSTTCRTYSVARSIQLIQETITNWQLVMLIVVFIAQIEDFNLKVKLSPRIIQIGTWAILISPWAVSVILVLSVSIARKDCFYVHYLTRQTLKILDTALPSILAVHLVLVAVFLRYRRFNRGHSRSMGTELMSRGPEIDSSLPYIVAVVISTICETIILIATLDYKLIWKSGYMKGFRIYITGLILTDARVVLMVLPWLLLPDIRERIKTWRPWYRPGPGIDLTMTYKKETI